MNHETSSDMQKKVKEKLERKFIILPLHHIDTSIILEPEKTQNGRFCKKYLQILGYNYRGRLSLPVMGELFIKINSLEDIQDRQLAFEIITDLIKARKIDFYVPESIGDLIQKIMNLDTRIKPTDAEILACSIEDNAKTLVTLDQVLINNKIIEQNFKIRINHPKELV